MELHIRARVRLLCAVLVVAALAVAGVSAQDKDAQGKQDKKSAQSKAGGNVGERFSAVVVNMDAPTGAAAQPVDILIERWSTDAERDQFINTLLEGTPERALNVLQKLPRVGAIRSPQSIGWDLRFAVRTVGTDGAERVMIVTDRPIGFAERRDAPRSIEYPFTVIELRVNSNGRGDGKMTVGTKITADREERTIVLENFTSQPVMINDVRRMK